jgi:hypothetical protein
VVLRKKISLFNSQFGKFEIQKAERRVYGVDTMQECVQDGARNHIWTTSGAQTQRRGAGKLTLLKHS